MSPVTVKKQPSKKPPPKPPKVKHQGAGHKVVRAHAPRKIPYAPIKGPRTSGWMIGSEYVIIQAWTVQLAVSARLGPDGMKLTGGYGAWEEVGIPRGDPYTIWKGRSLITATLDLVFDGWGVNPRSVEPELKSLEQLMTRIPGTDSPPSLRMWGAIPKAGLRWVITDADWGDCIRSPRSGARYRQAVTLKLLEYRAEQQVAHMPRAAATAKPPTKYKVKKGDTLKSIASKLLGASSKWQQIEKANKGLRGWKVPAKFVGKTIKVPPRTK